MVCFLRRSGNKIHVKDAVRRQFHPPPKEKGICGSFGALGHSVTSDVRTILDVTARLSRPTPPGHSVALTPDSIQLPSFSLWTTAQPSLELFANHSASLLNFDCDLVASL
ncbi:hypothetical protein Tco_1561192 [Tanacetum coccineum]